MEGVVAGAQGVVRGAVVDGPELGFGVVGVRVQPFGAAEVMHLAFQGAVGGEVVARAGAPDAEVEERGGGGGGGR